MERDFFYYLVRQSSGEVIYLSLAKMFMEDKEIVCTPEHPFYVLNATADRKSINFEGCEEKEANAIGSWIAAKDLRITDKLLLSNGKEVILEKTEVEHLSTPETTYNFEVEDFHTYYVGESGVCVHNACPVGRVYQDAPYHTSGNSVKSAKPIDGQVALNNSYQVSVNSPRRLGYSNNQLVVLDRIQIVNVGGIERHIYHGHVRAFSELSNPMKNIAIKQFGIRR